MPTGFDITIPKFGVAISSQFDILSQEQSLLRSKEAEQSIYPYIPFGPLSDAADLNILLNEPLQDAADELNTQKEEIDTIQEKLLESINSLTALKESCEEQLSSVRDKATTLSLVQQDEGSRQYWYVETFDTPFKTDQSRNTCLVDTTYSFCSLGVVQNETVGEVLYEIDRVKSVGIPGANLVLKSKGLRGKNVSPLPVFEGELLVKNDFSALNDGDSSSMLEWERNFIYSPQPVVLISHTLSPLVSMDNSTMSVEPLKITKFDWTTFIQWPNESAVDQGPNNNGYPMAGFITKPNQQTLALGQNRAQCVLVLTATLPSPQIISTIVLTPMIYRNARPTVNSIEVSSDGSTWILIGKDDALGERALSVSEQTRVADLKKGAGSAIYMVPTNRPVLKVRLTITGARYQVEQGFGHKFTVIYKHKRVDNSALFGLVSWASNSYWWERCANNKIPVNTVKSSNLLGNLPNTLGIAAAVAKTLTPKTKKVEVAPSTVSSFFKGTPGYENVDPSTGYSTGPTAPTLNVNRLNIADPITAPFAYVQDVPGGDFRPKTIEESRKDTDTYLKDMWNI